MYSHKIPSPARRRDWALSKRNTTDSQPGTVAKNKDIKSVAKDAIKKNPVEITPIYEKNLRGLCENENNA